MRKIITIKNWRRPYYYSIVLTALAQCDGIEEYEIINFVDKFTGKDFKDSFKTLDQSHGITKKAKSVKTVFHDTPQGCAKNTFYCFDVPFKMDDVDFVIHLEDDTVPSRDFLKYMEWAAENFRYDPEVFVVVGYNYQSKELSKKEFRDYYNKALKRVPPKTYQAWGIWRDRWEELRDDWFGIHWRSGEPHNVPEGAEFLNVITKADDGSWGWPMLKYHRKGRKEIAPVISRCQNIGEREGRFNASEQWHRANIYTHAWAECNEPPRFYEVVDE